MLSISVKKLCCILWVSLILIITPVRAQPYTPLSPKLIGNWFHQKNTNEWVIGFYDKLVYFKGNFWHYKVVQKRDNEIRLSLYKDKTVATGLMVEIISDTLIQVIDNSSRLMLCNKTRRMAASECDFEAKWKKPGKDTAWIKGYIDHRKLTSNKQIEFNVRNLILGKTTTRTAQVDEDGQFFISLPQRSPSTEVIVVFGRVFEHILIQPGDTAVVYIDLLPYRNAKTEDEIRNTNCNMVTAGRIGACNNEYRDYSRYIKKWDNYEEQTRMIRTNEQEMYKEYELRRKSIADSLLEVYKATYTMSNTVYEKMRQVNKYRLANALLRYSWLHDREKKVELSSDYLDLVNSFVIDDDKAQLAGYEFDGFIREVLNRMAVKHLSGRNEIDSFLSVHVSMTKALEYIWQNDRSLTVDQLGRIGELKKLAAHASTSKGRISINFSLKDTAERNKVMQQFGSILEYLNESDYLEYYFASQELLCRISQIDSLIPRGITRDYLLGHYLHTYFLDNKRLFLDDSILARIKGMVNNLNTYNIIAAENLQVMRDIDTEQYEDLLSSVPNTSEETVINKIARRNKGKVIYVDIWATWCGPCIEQFPYSKALKKHCEGKPVEFVYICADSEKSNWQSSIKKYGLSGQHYFLTPDEIARLKAKYDFNSYPRYMIINKEGRLVSSNSVRPENKEIVIPSIEHLLK